VCDVLCMFYIVNIGARRYGQEWTSAPRKKHVLAPWKRQNGYRRLSYAFTRKSYTVRFTISHKSQIGLKSENYGVDVEK